MYNIKIKESGYNVHSYMQFKENNTNVYSSQKVFCFSPHPIPFLPSSELITSLNFVFNCDFSIVSVCLNHIKFYS